MRSIRSDTLGARLFTLILCVIGGTASAQAPSVSAPRVASPPSLEYFAAAMASGAVPDTSMQQIDGFVNRFPRDGAPASQRTTAYLGRDEVALYVIFLCYADDPGSVRAHRVARDRIYDSDDSVAVQIDTFRDFRRAYGLQANFAGTKQDGYWIEGFGWSLDADFDYEVEGTRTARGYAMKFTIPFRSLDYPAGSETWGLLLFRAIPGSNEQAFWPGYSRRVQGRMNQAALLTELRELPPPARALIVPYIAADRTTVEKRRAEGSEIGVDAQTRLGSVDVGVTLNPDFSQIESDEPQIATNQRFELFFPEKRRFFSDHARYFSTPLDLLFTRRITSPELGAKASGQGSRVTWAALAVSDEPSDVQRRDVLATRGRVDLTPRLSLAGMAVALDGAERQNEVLAVDGRWQIAERWTLQSQLSGSRGRSSDAQLQDTAARLEVKATAATWQYELAYQDIGAEFAADVGFIPRAGIRQAEQLFSWRHYPSRSAWVSLGYDVTLDYVTDENGLRLDRQAELALVAELPRLTTISLFGAPRRERLLPRDYAGLLAPLDFDASYVGIRATTARHRGAVELEWSSGHRINIVPPAGELPRPARFTDASLSADFKLSSALTNENTMLYTRLEESAGARVFDQLIARSKWSYYFTPNLSIRLIGQYIKTRADSLHTRLADDEGANLDLLLAWQPATFRTLYIGSNTDFVGLDAAGGPAARGLDRFEKRAANLYLKLTWSFYAGSR